jgi:cytochrome oxidase assembly protein ShyY1
VIVTPLQTVDGSVVAIARGTVATADDPAVRQIPAGSVSITGTIQPFDGDPGTSSTLPPGQVSEVTAASLGMSGVAGGWVAQVPAQTGLAETPVAYGPTAGTGLRAQNVTYAIQWILFAGCVVFFWWRLLRDDVNDERARLMTSRTPDIGATAETATPIEHVEESASTPIRKKVY